MSLRIILAAITGMLVTVYSFAQTQETPVGLWRTIDDKTGKARSEVRITDSNGVLSGKIEKQLDADAKPDDKCDLCKDDRKDKLIQGMEIIRNVKKLDETNEWGNGEVLDPENGKTYRVKLKPIEGGKKLQMRGYIGPFYRTQVWVRAQ
jgi:uncharacterized protein (DUF2147 family)